MLLALILYRLLWPTFWCDIFLILCVFCALCIVEGRCYGDVSTVEELIAILSASKTPEGWPCRLTKTVDKVTRKTVSVSAKPTPKAESNTPLPTHEPNYTDPFRSFLPLRVIDKELPSSSKTKLYTIDQIQKGFGFHDVSSIIREIQKISANRYISTLDKEPILDLGQVATFKNPQRNTTPLPHSNIHFEGLHMDIID